MRTNYLGKSRLSVVIALSAASVAFAQSVKDSTKSKDIEQVILVGKNLTQVAKERKTPVAISTIKASDIQDRLGNREFPEIAKSTPSVYVTKVGGGYGDGRINIRGFDAVNIAVLINGQPVNDMEGGTVYWSNWTGLADIASNIQIQRGLGASKLVVPSVGGTFNVVTKATEAKQGGLIKVDAANNNYSKFTASYSTGLLKSGWATTVLLSRWQGDGYVNGTYGEGYSWFFSSGLKINEKHAINFTATGAPQVHNTRRATATNAPAVTIGSLMKYGRRYNPQTGLLNGEEFNVAPNFYHKPIASLNWDWTINDKLALSTVVYASWGRGGGGTGLNGSIKNAANQSMNYINNGTGGDGTINWDMIYNYNQGRAVTDYKGNSFQKNNTVMNAGDGGAIGNEEIEIIEPAIKELFDEGILAFGPYPADSFFQPEKYSSFDGVLAMYHDQGLAPFKTIGYEEGVNYTAGLPFIRTSPDHGTAYDIAGKNLADAHSFSEAIFTAIKIFKNRTEYQELTKNPLKPKVFANDNGIDEDLPEENE